MIARKQRLYLRSCAHCPSVIGVIERLYSVWVPSQEHLVSAGIPQRKSEHPAQIVYHLFAAFFIEMNEYFGICMRAEHVTLADKSFSQDLVIVDLAIEDDLN